MIRGYVYTGKRIVKWVFIQNNSMYLVIWWEVNRHSCQIIMYIFQYHKIMRKSFKTDKSKCEKFWVN